MLKFTDYLTEEISTSDRKKLTSQIVTFNRKDTTLKLKSFNKEPIKFVYSDMKNVVNLQYNKDLEELTLVLVEICDTMGLTFSEKSSGDNTILTILA